MYGGDGWGGVVYGGVRGGVGVEGISREEVTKLYDNRGPHRHSLSSPHWLNEYPITQQ